MQHVAQQRAVDWQRPIHIDAAELHPITPETIRRSVAEASAGTEPD